MTVKNVSITLSRQQNVIIRVGIADDGNADIILGEYNVHLTRCNMLTVAPPVSNKRVVDRRDVRQCAQTNRDPTADDIDKHVYNR